MTANKYKLALEGLVIEDPVKSFFDYCKERENIRVKREAGENFPWSDDIIFQKGRFLNVFSCAHGSTKHIFGRVPEIFWCTGADNRTK